MAKHVPLLLVWFGFVYNMFGLHVDPCVVLSIEPSRRPQRGLQQSPEGTCEEEGDSGGPCQSLLKGSRSPLKTRGVEWGWGGLATSCGHVARTKPFKDKTKQMDPAELRELSVSSETEAVQLLISVFTEGFTSSFLYKDAFAHLVFCITDLHSTPFSSFLLPLSISTIYFFKVHTSFPLNPLQVHLICLFMLH